MKKLKLLTGLLLAAATLGPISACTDGFEEMNVNPNQNPNVVPETLLAPALTDLVKRNMDRALRLTNDLMQVHVARNDNDEVHRYVIRTAEADYMWNGWYTQLTDFRDMYASAKAVNSNTFMGIALICEVWTFSLLTDTFGDVPYTDAIGGRSGILQPRFDRQEVIYEELFRKLEEANELLKTNVNLTADQTQLDPLYQGNALKWRKFGNSLYLRLLMRVSRKTDAIANGMSPQAKLRDMVNTNASNYPLIANNTESAILRWTGTAPYQSVFQTYRVADFSGFTSMSEFFVNNLVEWNDPRIGKWATLYNGTYEGVQSGYAQNQVPVAKSTYPNALMTEPLLGNIINYGEVQLLLAEAALRGWISGDAKTYYETGATNGITLWGLTVPTNYLAGSDVKWEPSSSFDTKLDQIHLQKYYALFFTDFQQWFEYRRTGHPVLPLGPGLKNNRQMPARLNYPLYVQSLNQQNYQAAVADQGADDINTKVWWQE
ncbi:SusD/RagB family nutrient-binding outer membrane lipoprotein [Hymenobacter sp. BT186]|uniref:SusD/RagB family nutrient-binding outer membrane lipoprotein n=1 Tax=Hymenobacter telluris TaxID=2816474 RepID=A0A939JER0_9BACT|nr:SusD/RagB family nutrient-binding outer membrane lipoprotein [Hymenobacter telluris]MBO0360223.1 SusD/RagB family nutrient-binding outer membrane lipoprotein [Hymenobacter telluris]MBW3376250.1 SusD/RagB family nutrient-binding outer membrane lipoprotein [Hymenobacter norwichensis]